MINCVLASFVQAKIENVASCETTCRLESDLEVSQQRSCDLQQRCDSTEYELKHIERNLHEAIQEKQAVLTRCSLLEERLGERVDEMERLKDELRETAEVSKVSFGEQVDNNFEEEEEVQLGLVIAAEA